MTQETTISPLVVAAQAVEEWYHSLQEHFTLTEPDDDTKFLVSNQANFSQPVHRWYNLKESFSYRLPVWLYDWMQRHYNHTPVVVLDPFLGSGTSGVSLAPLGVRLSGVELNPFIRFVAGTKAAGGAVSPSELKWGVRQLETRMPFTGQAPLPALSTLHNPRYVSPENIQTLLSAGQQVRALKCSAPLRDVLLVGIAATIEAAFNLYKDGRALRYKSNRAVEDVHPLLSRHWRNMLADVACAAQERPSANPVEPAFTVYAGSAVDLRALFTLDGQSLSLRSESFDTLLYSPPYLNNFDYAEIYKLEMWLLGFVKSYEAWKTLRLETIRSHHSIVFPETNYLAGDTRTQAIAQHIQAMGDLRCVPDKERARVKRVITGYFDDMYLALKEQWRVLKAGGILVYVVANSRHYYLPVATDVLLGEIARCIGFEPLDLVVLRKRNGRTRQKLFLRESAVFLRKPCE